MWAKVQLNLTSNVSGFLLEITDKNSNVLLCKTIDCYGYKKDFYTTHQILNIKIYPLKQSVYPTVIKRTVTLNFCSCNLISQKLIFSDNRYRNYFRVTDAVYGLPVQNATLFFQNN